MFHQQVSQADQLKEFLTHLYVSVRTFSLIYIYFLNQFINHKHLNRMKRKYHFRLFTPSNKSYSVT